jgi:hypothetical protein
MPKPVRKKPKQKRDERGRLVPPDPRVKAAGLHKDLLWGSKRFDEFSTGIQKWMFNRYRKTCPGCGERYWSEPGLLPVCPRCAEILPTGALGWWWKSKKTQRVLERFLDTYFDGGYDVPEDPRQLAGWRSTIREIDDGKLDSA